MAKPVISKSGKAAIVNLKRIIALIETGRVDVDLDMPEMIANFEDIAYFENGFDKDGKFVGFVAPDVSHIRYTFAGRLHYEG